MVIRHDKMVTFVFRPKTACRQVYLSGTFNDWSDSEDRMLRQKDGTFRKRLTLDPGQYQYKFVVDGSWCEDVEADEFVHNEFGTRNAVVSVS